jgi:hypothetical protein
MAMPDAAILGMVFVMGMLLRIVTAMSLSPHVDEPSSLLAARIVSDRGFPLLPSGTVYLQGATLSYLLQPFFWAGLGDLEHLRIMRLVVVLAGSLAIVLGYRLGVLLTGDTRVGILMSVLIALDPLSVQWSGLLRMYGLLQPLTIGLAMVFVTSFGTSRGIARYVLLAGLFWAAVFTHIGAAVLWPPMVVAALLVHRGSLIRNLHLLATLAVCAVAPVTLIALNAMARSPGGSSPDASSTSQVPFVGNTLLAPFARLQAGFHDWDWSAPLRISNLAWLAPGLIVAIASLVCVWRMREARIAGASGGNTAGFLTMLVMYWVPIVAVGFFTVAPKERYLLNVHLLGYVFVAMLVVGIRPRTHGQDGRDSRLWTHGLLAATLAVAILGVGWRLGSPVVHPDYNVAMDFVARHHSAGQPVIVALPPVAWQALPADDHDDLAFLAGPQDHKRARGYTRADEDGFLIDYWVGIPAIDSGEYLASYLRQHPDAWVVVDEERLRADWAYGGEMERILMDATVTVFEAPGGALVMRPAGPYANDGASEETSDLECPRAPGAIR